MKPQVNRFRIPHASPLVMSPLIFFYACAFFACATMGPPQPPSLELPKPPTDLRAVRKGNKVTLTWTIPLRTTDRKVMRSIGPTLICRGLIASLAQCGTAVGQFIARPATTTDKAIRQKPAESYTDVLPDELQTDDPAATVTYAIEVRNADGNSAGLSNQVRVPLLRTISPPELHATLTKDGVVLSWSRNVARTETQSPVRYVYRVYRRLEGSAQWNPIGDFPAGGDNDTTLTDSNIEWEKTYEFRIVILTVIAQSGTEERVEGEDSPVVSIFAHDIFPPSVPAGLQAVFSGPGQQPFIDLIWAPVTDVDLDGYNVYRHEEGSTAVKINATLVKTPAYRDEGVTAGKHYFYSVSAVDVRGNESARSEDAGENVPE